MNRMIIVSPASMTTDLRSSPIRIQNITTYKLGIGTEHLVYHGDILFLQGERSAPSMDHEVPFCLAHR